MKLDYFEEIEDAIDEYRMMINYEDKEDLKDIRKAIQDLRKRKRNYE